MGQAPSAWRNRVRFAGVMIEARWVVLATMLVTFDVLLVVGTLLSRAGLLPL